MFSPTTLDAFLLFDRRNNIEATNAIAMATIAPLTTPTVSPVLNPLFALEYKFCESSERSFTFGAFVDFGVFIDFVLRLVAHPSDFDDLTIRMCKFLSFDLPALELLVGAFEIEGETERLGRDEGVLERLGNVDGTTDGSTDKEG